MNSLISEFIIPLAFSSFFPLLSLDPWFTVCVVPWVDGGGAGRAAVGPGSATGASEVGSGVGTGVGGGCGGDGGGGGGGGWEAHSGG